jgi:hypothetical protein
MLGMCQDDCYAVIDTVEDFLTIVNGFPGFKKKNNSYLDHDGERIPTGFLTSSP